MHECRLCPRACGADRSRNPGRCLVGDTVLVARAAPHFGEEPCISGKRGSGAVFFAGCPLGCVYCQNFELSRGRQGEEVSVERLAELFRTLEARRVHNLNLVTGTQFLPQITDALSLAAPKIPTAWNTSGYETVDAVDALSERVSIFMPDYKYAVESVAESYSKAPDYPDTARRAIGRMVEKTGPYVLSESGLLRRGVLIRHLVLPGQLENTRRVIRWVSDTFAPGEVLFSLMAQYTPCGEMEKYPELSRRLTEEEWNAALEMLEESRIEDGFVQELSAAGEEEIPEFDGTGVSR